MTNYIELGYEQLSRGALRLLDPVAAGRRLTSALRNILPHSQIEIAEVRIIMEAE